MGPGAARFLRSGEIEDAEVEQKTFESIADLAKYGAKQSRTQTRWSKVGTGIKTGQIYAHADAFRELRRELHIISSYRQLVSTFSVPLEDQTRWEADLERLSDEFKEKMLSAMLDRYQLVSSAASAAKLAAGTRLTSERSSRSFSASSRRESAGADDSFHQGNKQGVLQLLVKWGLPGKAKRVLTDQEGLERTAAKLQHALQVVLEHGDDRFLDAPSPTPISAPEFHNIQTKISCAERQHPAIVRSGPCEEA